MLAFVRSETIPIIPSRACTAVFDQKNLDAVYRLVKCCHMPELFSFPPPESTIAALKTENRQQADTIHQPNARIKELEAEIDLLKQKLAQSKKW